MKPDIKTKKLLGLKVAVTDPEEAAIKVLADIEELGGEYITFANVHALMMSRGDQEYKKAQQEALMVMPDGKPLAWCLNKRGYDEAERVAGPDFFQRSLAMSSLTGKTHYLYGSSPETLEALKKKIEKRYPGAKIVGYESPPFHDLSEEEEKAAIDRMNASGADYIWIGLGAPKQELFMQRHKGEAKGLMLGVGAGFDFMAGTAKRAPVWMRWMGLEWLYRLLQDPGRLWKRYVVTNTQFICLMLPYMFWMKKEDEK